MKTSGNTMLITGGGSGIGRRLAEEFHKLGNTVIIAGRRRALLEAVAAANPGMATAVLDVEDPEGVNHFAVRIVAEHPALNVLVNNAGIMRAEDLRRGPESLVDAEATVLTNLLGPIRLTAALLPHLLGRPSATIMNVSSGLAFVPLVSTPTYSATKAAIHSYTVSLRQQLRDTAVEVVELIPPGVRTDLMPGHATNPMMMPLEDFIAEAMTILRQQPTPAEICVQRVNSQRRAEADGRFEVVLDALNQPRS